MMTEEKTISSVAKEMYDNMESKTRTNGDKYYCLIDYKVEWQTDIIREAHPDGRLPSDEVYEVITDTLELLKDVDTEDEAQDRISEIEANVYTSALTKWLHSHNGNVYYLTQAIEEMGCTDGFKALSTAQYLFKQEIASAVLRGIQAYIQEGE